MHGYACTCDIHPTVKQFLIYNQSEDLLLEQGFSRERRSIKVWWLDRRIYWHITEDILHVLGS